MSKSVRGSKAFRKPLLALVAGATALAGAAFGAPAQAAPGAANSDFDGNGRSDLAVFRPTNGNWYVRNQTSVQFGVRNDIPLNADFDNDGINDISVWRPSNGQWYIRNGARVVYGQNGDVPVPGNYTGDGGSDIAVWRPSNGTWYVRGISGGVQFGDRDDFPLVSDFSGDGRAEFTVYRPSTRQIFTKGRSPIQVGVNNVNLIPVAADYDGNNRTDVQFYNRNNGNFRNTSGNLVAQIPGAVSTDIPVILDYDGDGQTEHAVFRPSTGYWIIENTVSDNALDNTYISIRYGAVNAGFDGDIPISQANNSAALNQLD